MMKTQQLTPFANAQMPISSKIGPSTSADLNNYQLPEEILRHIASYVPPKDRLKLQLVCRRFKTLFSQWPDVCAMEVRAEVYECSMFLKEIKI